MHPKNRWATSLLRFTPCRVKTFIALLAVFFWPPLLYLLGIALQLPLIAILGFLPALFWINIPAVLAELALAPVGISAYEFREFGALPEGLIGWGMIVLFWISAAFLLSTLGERFRSR